MPRDTTKAKYWMLTIPHHQFVPFKHTEVAYIKGQLEEGTTTGYLHWQLLVVFPAQVRRGYVLALYGPIHAEPSRSAAADEYVWKEASRIPGK